MSGRASWSDLSAYADDQWIEPSLFCICSGATCSENYYGFVFEHGKVKPIKIKDNVAYLPGNAIGIQYSLVKIFAAKKVFWKSTKGVNSLDRNNLLHLLNGREQGWCKKYPTLSIIQMLNEKIEIGHLKNSKRTISDQLQ